MDNLNQNSNFPKLPNKSKLKTSVANFLSDLIGDNPDNGFLPHVVDSTADQVNLPPTIPPSPDDSDLVTKIKTVGRRARRLVQAISDGGHASADLSSFRVFERALALNLIDTLAKLINNPRIPDNIWYKVIKFFPGMTEGQVRVKLIFKWADNPDYYAISITVTRDVMPVDDRIRLITMMTVGSIARVGLDDTYHAIKKPGYSSDETIRTLVAPAVEIINAMVDPTALLFHLISGSIEEKDDVLSFVRRGTAFLKQVIVLMEAFLSVVDQSTTKLPILLNLLDSGVPQKRTLFWTIFIRERLDTDLVPIPVWSQATSKPQ